MEKHNCQKCRKIWYGWAQEDICPDCGGELEMEKKEECRSGKERRIEEDRRKFDELNYKGSERRSGQDRRTDQYGVARGLLKNL